MNPTSTDGNCGSNSDTNSTCLTSRFGNCCSSKGFCGSTIAYCGEGCQLAFGKCNDASVQTISTSGSCGSTATSNVTCLGSTYGDCCSSLGYCGGNSSYCGSGCQSMFGSCDLPSSSSSSSSSMSMTTTTSSSASTSTESGTSMGGISLDGNCGSNSIYGATCLGSTYGDCCSNHGYCGGNISYCAAGCQSDFGTCTISTASSGGKLSSSAIAGISVGASVAGLSLIALLVWLVFFRRKKSEMPMEPELQDTKDAKVGFHEAEIMNEMDGRSTAFPVELPASRP